MNASGCIASAIVRPSRYGHSRCCAARHLRSVGQRDELHVLGVRRRLESLQEIAELETDPRDHHRPRLDAAVPIDALLERVRLQDVLERKRARLLAASPLTCTDHGDVFSVCASGRIALAGAELVVLVVSRDVLEGVDLLRRSPAISTSANSRRSPAGRGFARHDRRHEARRDGGRQHGAPIENEPPRDLGWLDSCPISCA